MGIGTVLLQRGLISRAQLEDALGEQRRTGERLDRVLVRMGFVTREQVLEAIGEQFHMPVVDLATMAVEAKVLKQLPARLVHRQNCVPIAQANGTLTVATSDPFEISVLDELRLLAGCSIDLVLADEEDLHKFIRLNYGVGSDTLDEMSASLEAEPALTCAVPCVNDNIVKRLFRWPLLHGNTDNRSGYARCGLCPQQCREIVADNRILICKACPACEFGRCAGLGVGSFGL